MKPTLVNPLGAGARPPLGPPSRTAARAPAPTNAALTESSGDVVYFGPGIPYATGLSAAVAVNNAGLVLGAHRASDGTLFYEAGVVNRTTIDWSSSPTGPEVGSGCAVSMNNAGLFVEVHRGSGDDDSLFYQVGHYALSSVSRILTTSSSTPYDTGSGNVVALNDGNVVVEVHQGSGDGNLLFYRVGQLDTSGSASGVTWGPSFEFDEGSSQGVALNNQGVVVEVHRGAGEDERLFCRVGQVSGIAIGWYPRFEYGKGSSATVALNNHGMVVEVHQGSGDDTRLYYQVGRIDQTRVVWGSPAAFDSGSGASVALNDENIVVEVQRGADEQLSYRTGDLVVK